MNFIAIFLIGIGLSMDAFAVSICQGLIQSGHNKKEMEKIAFTFGFFQFGMTFLGGIAGKIVLPFVKGYEHIIPCIIFCGIAVFMLKEGWKNRHNSCEAVSHLDGFKTLFLLGVATSMDALFVGITFALQVNYPLFWASVLIGCTTFMISAIGYYFGKSFSDISKNKAYYLGAVLLFGLGIHSLIR
ncbi:manganese efflux pump MntP family protein [Fusobacterium necrophorum]|uniref:Putative manganese efflux pump MntP n=1 Tax=Fusobacterium necrophorum TaxID=859 RepID=A0A4Q2KZB1_9FUSO|nr:manganese efflux pump MntP family protein [Fusobacterium necrophorum]RXZ71065.1 manganese efflux pump MntP family protein [Fusobacterium necrophorum]